jgi:hypothetical protein
MIFKGIINYYIYKSMPMLELVPDGGFIHIKFRWHLITSWAWVIIGSYERTFLYAYPL